jgi:hypothetical protein
VSQKRATTGLTPSPRFWFQTFWFQTFVAVVRRPGLWWTATRQVLRMARRRWWTQPPFLPVPDRNYVRFRLETAYGMSEPRAADVVRYLEWCRTSERASSRVG